MTPQALPSWPTGRCTSRRRLASSAIWRSCWRRNNCPEQPWHRAHPVGHPRRPNGRQCPSAHLFRWPHRLVHNGIIENYVTLREELEQVGIICVSETDTEIVAQLLGQQVSAGLPLAEAMRVVCGRLRGAFTLVAVDSQVPDTVVAARRNSPLVVGVGEGENFVASDVAAFIEHTREAIELGQDQLVSITPDGVEVITFDGEPAVVKPYHVDWDLSAAEKGGYDWFMRKEIYEQPRAVADTLLGRHDANAQLTLDEIRISEAELRRVDKIIVVACGTAFYAGLVAKYAIEHWTRIPARSSSRVSSATVTRSSGRPPSSSRSASPVKPPTP